MFMRGFSAGARPFGSTVMGVMALAIGACIAMFVWAPSAWALSITEAAYTGPVAYELKSLQTTHFYATVDTPGVWATLRIKDGEGRVVKTIYSGAIQEANKRFWFPAWNGLDNSGNRLFSASWNWELAITKGGQTSTKTGKITVSKIEFFVSGWLAPGETVTFDRYMIPGNANMYVRVTELSGSGNAFNFGIADDRWAFDNGGAWVLPYETQNLTHYYRPPRVPTQRGMHRVHTNAANLGSVFFYITVIQ